MSDVNNVRKYYCYYCGLLQHRCLCSAPNSRLRQFLLAADPPRSFSPTWVLVPYKRAVPPQLKRRYRAELRAHYAIWLSKLSEQYGYMCMHCGATNELVIDHIVPIALGGLSELDNLQLLCRRCNNLKGKLVYDCRPSSLI